MNTDRIAATLANLNMRTDAWKPLALTIFLAACQNRGVAPTISVDPGSNNNNSSEINPALETEIAKITSATLTEVTNQAEKKAVIASLPIDRPATKDGNENIAVYDIKVGEITFKMASYFLTDDQIQKQIEEGLTFIHPTDNKLHTFSSVLYIAGINKNGEFEWGLHLPVVKLDDPDRIHWSYQQSFPSTIDEMKDVLDVLEYDPDGANMLFTPLISEPNFIPGYETNTPLVVNNSGEIAPGMKVQARLVEPESPTASYQNMEKEYLETLTDEQMALYEQYASEDRTSEGLVRRFLEHEGLKTYLAYIDVNPDSKDLNEVVAVWNPEQQKSNPAKLIGTDVLILNGTSGDKIEFTGPQAEDTLEEYFKYFRANIIALSKGEDLPNELDTALADPRAIEYLANGAQVNLRAIRSESYSPRKYYVPEQTISISESTSIVFKTVKEPDPNMFFITKGPDIYMGWSIGQSAGGPLTINYSSNGLDTIQGSNSSMLLSKRISKVMHSLFSRASNNDSSDTITNTTIFNGGDLSTKSLIIYTK